MKYFLELTIHEGELCVQHEKLVEYGVMSSKQSNQRRPAQTIDPVKYCNYYLLLEKTYKLYTDYEKIGLVEDEEYLLRDIPQQVQSGTKQLIRWYILDTIYF